MLYEDKYSQTEMFIIDELISSVNDFICITEHLMYLREHSVTSAGSSASLFFFLCLQFLGASSLQCCWDKVKDVSQSARPNTVGGIWWETEAGSYTQSQDVGRWTVAGWKIMAERERSNVPRDPSIVMEDLVGRCCIPREEARDLYTEHCSPDSACVCGESIKKTKIDRHR